MIRHQNHQAGVYENKAKKKEWMSRSCYEQMSSFVMIDMLA